MREGGKQRGKCKVRGRYLGKVEGLKDMRREKISTKNVIGHVNGEKGNKWRGGGGGG